MVGWRAAGNVAVGYRRFPWHQFRSALPVVASQRDDGLVLEQQQGVSDAAFLAEIHQAFLKSERSGVVNRAELEDGDHESR